MIIRSRDLAFCGVFGAAGLLLPVLFHFLRLGHIFMPMYLPLVSLAFFTRPLPVAVTAGVTPIISGLLTGMPPFYPPVAPIMSVELALMGTVISLTRRLFPQIPVLGVLIPVLILGRMVNVALVYGAAYVMHLPPAFVAGASLLTGWPGVILMIVTIPTILRLAQSVSAGVKP